MTFYTGNFFVPAIKFKIRFVMIEIGNCPGIIIMAPEAVCNSVYFKLPVVIISMAGIAILSKIRKPLLYAPCIIFWEMAGSTGSFRMYSIELKTGLRMIKSNLIPSFLHMTGFTI